MGRRIAIHEDDRAVRDEQFGAYHGGYERFRNLVRRQIADW
jgi:hypothetical protein